MDGDSAARSPIERDDLGFPGQFALWSWRIWVLGLHRERSSVPVIDRAFAVLGAAGGGRLTDRLMMTLAEGARRPIDIRPPCYRTLSDDELRLLESVRYLQDGDAVRPLFVLSPMLNTERRGPAHAALGDLSRLLLTAGIDLTAPAGELPYPFSGRRPDRCDA
jgi:hypothetical protein